MTKNILAGFLLLSLSITSVNAEQTQADLNQSACIEFKKIDKQLNDVYKQALNLHSSHADFKKYFIQAQRKWIEFRDAHIASVYLPSKNNDYGSSLPMCQCYLLQELTQQRITQLKVWIDGAEEEGDVCVGTTGS